ncbi:unnamed protein product [Ranitomeya imitator]|uniref:VWF/SSPO/Zonadhesin-like cysteine-rich domain-containing protein n=1 Tax=Ranitomeya imitator TaxID=111125 RepID=A0ABN9L629_9NEOB|nr:unnamed protein product [Ranitomeya imitator]
MAVWRRHPSNIRDLEQFAEEEWSKIPPEHSTDNTFSSIHFGNQQNINDPNEECNDTEETQATNPVNCSKYRSECEEHLHQDAFSDCMKLMNLEPYIEACMIDMCSCDNSQDSFCLCSSITEYSRQCSHAGGHPRNWRTPDFCPKQCPANMIYQESASPCKDSCSNFETHNLCEEHYMDGCFCPEGLGRIVEGSGTINSAVYQKILKENVWPSVRDLKLKHAWVLEQANDTQLTGKSTSEWLKKNTIKTLEWP